MVRRERRDLIHPHHDNELVQSQAACDACDAQRLQGGRDFVRWWMHNGFVNGPRPAQVLSFCSRSRTTCPRSWNPNTLDCLSFS